MTATIESGIDVPIPGGGDEAPPTENPQATTVGPFTDLYPDSTPEAPYGRKPDGTPYKRHHGGRGSRSVTGPQRMPASESLARSAAGVLATANSLTAIALMAGNLTVTAEAINDANKQFEEMAYQALLTDPALCKKILSAGASGGKAGLLMAYAMLTANIFPSAMAEFKERRQARLEEATDVDD